MNDKYDRLSFLAYINNPMTWEVITMVYTKNNIKYEKCQLYSDFVQSLLITVFDTYMGDDVTPQEEQNNHFIWCWNKTIEIFKEEGINFKNDRIMEYFSEFMFEVFYFNQEKNKSDYTDKTILKLWLDIFDYTKLKTNADIDTFIEIYRLMEMSLKT
jgi:hypothetical protein